MTAETTEPAVTEPEITEPAVTEPEITEPPHSDIYLEGVAVEDVLLWFNEVVLDSEFLISGDPSMVQKWEDPILYSIHGNATQEDLDTLESFEQWLNDVEGFPGIRRAEPEEWANLQIYFTDAQGMMDTLGQDFQNMDGGFQFWYDANNRVYDGQICILTDLDQYLRNSVVLEELYNALGPAQDTQLREDSIIYQSFSQPQELTDVDRLILKLLYHPQIRCGMDMAQCEAVIRSLYY